MTVNCGSHVLDFGGGDGRGAKSSSDRPRSMWEKCKKSGRGGEIGPSRNNVDAGLTVQSLLERKSRRRDETGLLELQLSPVSQSQTNHEKRSIFSLGRYLLTVHKYAKERYRNLLNRIYDIGLHHFGTRSLPVFCGSLTQRSRSLAFKYSKALPNKLSDVHKHYWVAQVNRLDILLANDVLNLFLLQPRPQISSFAKHA